MNKGLWIVQALLAALFLFAGGAKLVMPVEEMTKEMPQMPALFLRFIAVCEIIGAFGLILPGLTGILPALTPLAAAALAIIMIGATIITVMIAPAAMVLLPLITGVLCVFVAYGRWRVAPHGESRASLRQSAS